MNMNLLKSALSLTLSVCLGISCVSCRSKSSEIADIPQNAALLTLRSADVDMAENFDEIINLDKNNSNILIFGRLKTGEYGGFVTDSNFSEKNIFTFEPQEGETVKSSVLINGGKKAVLTILNETTMLYIFGINNNLENTYDCGKILESEDTYTEMAAGDDGFYINVNRESIAFIDKNGEYAGDVNISGRNICNISKNNDNIPVAVLNDKNNLIIANMKATDILEEQKIEDSDIAIWSICAGIGDYSYVTVFGDGLYGLKEDQWVKICDFSENDFSSHNLLDIIMTAEKEFAAVIKTDDNRFEIRLLTERDISEIKEKKIIKMAVAVGRGSDIYDNTIKKFNSANDAYKVELINYGETGEFPADWADNLKKDIIAGNSPDIVTFDSNIPIDTFGEKESIFVDLYSLLDNDSDFSRTDFIDGFLEGMASDGKLLMIDSGFTLQSLCIKNKFADNLNQWDYDQFLEIYNNMPDDMTFNADMSNLTRTHVFMNLINYNSFIDYDNASCDFKSDNFIKAMKFINENEIGLTNDQADAMWDSPGMTYTEQADLYRTDKALVSKCGINSFFSIKETTQGYFNEPATFIGYPSEAGNGTFRTINRGYAIMANSDNIEGAWEFLKYYLFSYPDDLRNTRSEFSGLEKNFTAQLEYEKTEHLEKDPETGEMTNMDGYWLGGDFGNTIQIEPFTDDEAEKYEKFVRNSVKNTFKPNMEVEQIIKEELDSYFNGERSAEETADIIQNRVSIYISENYD